MDDKRIIELYFERSENAIKESENKYGRYCHVIAYNILYSNEDAKECVNDTWMRAWGAIPPTVPASLCAFFARIVRGLALDRYAYNNAIRRSKNLECVLDEVCDFISFKEPDPSDTLAIKAALDSFLASLSARDRIIFVQRYFYLMPIKEISEKRATSEGNVKVILNRTRNKLKAHLEKEGIQI